jgi:excinuclease ABC subunit B
LTPTKKASCARTLADPDRPAAVNLNGRAILYADRITGSMERAIGETERRREKQIAFNAANGITPKGVFKDVADIMEGAKCRARAARSAKAWPRPPKKTPSTKTNLRSSARDQQTHSPTGRKMYAPARDLELKPPHKCAMKSANSGSGCCRFNYLNLAVH